MGKDGSQKRHGTAPASRQDRLKAALKANISRRKEQARARADRGDRTDDKTNQK